MIFKVQGFQEAKSGCIKLERVVNESKFVANQLIKKYVRKGSIIITDEGNAFNDIESLVDDEGNSMEYSHRTVCHSGQYCSGGVWSHFKDHDTGVDNNGMEGMCDLQLLEIVIFF